MTRYAVITLAIGYQRFWKRTHAIMRQYAQKIGADFIKITHSSLELDVSVSNSYKLEKFRIYDYLSTYDRVIFFDGDIVIHPQCPNLFDLVPEDKLGVVCENKPYYNRDITFQSACKFYGVKYSVNLNEWFNTGIMVISKAHQKMFLLPQAITEFTPQHVDGTLSQKPESTWLDMPMLNALRIINNIEIKNLGFKFNYLNSLRNHPNKPFEPEEAFIFHGSGLGKFYIYKIIKQWYGGLKSLRDVDLISIENR